MADTDYFGAEYGAEQTSRFLEVARNFGAANWAGAVTSLGLAAGLSVWAVDLTFRDVSRVPVIQAAAGPMRVAPEEPGGTTMPYQGLALSDITSGAGAAPAPEQIVLAPPIATLDAPSIAQRAAAMAQQESPVAEIETPETVELADVVLTLVQDEVVAPDADDKAAVGDLAAANPGALFLTPPEAEAGEEVETAETLNPLEPGLSTSNRPRTRPAALRALANTIPESPLAAPKAEGTRVASLTGTRDVSISDITPGSKVVQLGAFDSDAIARAEWDRMQSRFGDYLSGKSRMIQQASSGGRDFWRLRVVGFADGAETDRFCAAMIAQGQACIPVTMR